MDFKLKKFNSLDANNFPELLRYGWREASVEERLRGFSTLDLFQNGPRNQGGDTSLVQANDLEPHIPFRFTPRTEDRSSRIEINRDLLEAGQPYGAMRAFQCSQAIKQSLNTINRLPEEKSMQAFADEQSCEFYAGIEKQSFFDYFRYTADNPQKIELQGELTGGRSGDIKNVSAYDQIQLTQDRSQANAGQDIAQGDSLGQENSEDYGYYQGY